MNEPNPYAPPSAALDGVNAGGARPSLWNPNAAALWSLLFSPILGAYLHMRNWEALGQPERALQSRRWIIGTVAFHIVIVAFSALASDVPAAEGAGRLGALGVLLGWYFHSGKSQVTLVGERFGSAYTRRGWARPLLVATGLLAAYTIAVGAVLVLTGAA